MARLNMPRDISARGDLPGRLRVMDDLGKPSMHKIYKWMETFLFK